MKNFGFDFFGPFYYYQVLKKKKIKKIVGDNEKCDMNKKQKKKGHQKLLRPP